MNRHERRKLKIELGLNDEQFESLMLAIDFMEKFGEKINKDGLHKIAQRIREADAAGEPLRAKGQPPGCWDCGSTIDGHHTPLCETSPLDAIRDLPMADGTQYWSGGIVGAAFDAGVKEFTFQSPMNNVVNSVTKLPGSTSYRFEVN